MTPVTFVAFAWLVSGLGGLVVDYFNGGRPALERQQALIAEDEADRLKRSLVLYITSLCAFSVCVLLGPIGLGWAIYIHLWPKDSGVSR